MSKFDVLTDIFFKTIKIKKHFSIVDKVGLQDTTINISKIPASNDLEFSIKELYIFCKDGSLIISSKYKENPQTNNNFTKISKFVKDFYKDNNFYSSTTEIKDSFRSPLKGEVEDNFIFNKIYSNNQKIIMLSKSNLVIVGVFGNGTISSIIKLYLLHIYIAFVNFLGDTIEMITNPKNSDISSLDRGSNYQNRDFFQVKIFEFFFLNSITHHFEKIIKILLKKEEMFLTNIKFKNFYLIDITTGEFLCDLTSLSNKKKRKIRKNERLWQELLHHSHNLMNQYKADFQSKYDSSNAFYNFVKVECTSTYPRLTFIIKFLPILNGISFIHVYSQNKLSRYNDAETSVSQIKNYKEIEIIYGNDIKNSTNIEFRYTEPKKLKEIEKFFLEFFSSTINKFNMFYNPSLDLKYFDNSMILAIDDLIIQNKKSSNENLFAKINSKFYEMYINDNNERIKNNYGGNMNMLTNTNQNVYFQDVGSDSNYENTNTENGTLVNTNFMNINKQFILKELFANQIGIGTSTIKGKPFDNDNSYINNKNDNTLILSRIDDNTSKLKYIDYDVSFDLAKQMSEISNLDYNDEENINSYMKGVNIPTINYNPTESMDILLTDLDKEKLTPRKILDTNSSKRLQASSNIPKDRSVTKSLNKLQQSIINIENKNAKSGNLSKKNSLHHKKSKNRMNSQILPPKSGQHNYNIDTGRERGKSQDIPYSQNEQKIDAFDLSKLHKNVIFKNQVNLEKDAQDTLSNVTDNGKEVENEYIPTNQMSESNLRNIYNAKLNINEGEENIRVFDQPNVVIPTNNAKKEGDYATFR